MEKEKIKWNELTCQETTGMIGDDYIRCGAKTVGIVLHYRDQKAYPMCLPCTVHNVNNRGGVLLASIDDEE